MKERRFRRFRAMALVFLEFLVLLIVEGLHRVMVGPAWVIAALLACAVGIWAARAMGFTLLDLLSVEYGAALSVFLALWVALGTLVVQGKELAYYLANYGILARPILTLSLDRVFYCGWFRGLMALLGFSLIGVSLRRPSWRFRLIHLGVAVTLLGGMVSDFIGVRGYMELHPHRALNRIVLQQNGHLGNRLQILPFVVTLKEFRVDRYPSRPELYLYRQKGERFVRVRRLALLKRKRVKIGDDSLEVLALERLPSGGNGQTGGIAATLQLSRPGGGEPGKFHLKPSSPPVLLPGGRYALALRTLSPPREYASLLAFNNKKESREEWVRVNHPVRFGGYRFFQSGYRGGNDPFSGITVKKDPGFPVVVAGLIILLIGLAACTLRRER